jgi:DNA mismatch repair protein MSH6
VPPTDSNIFQRATPASVFFSPAVQASRPAWGCQQSNTPRTNHGYQASPAPWIQPTPSHRNMKFAAPPQPRASMPQPALAPSPMQAPLPRSNNTAPKSSDSPTNSESTGGGGRSRNGAMKKFSLSDKKKHYGPSSTFTFTAKPDPAIASKKLAQATLGQTMKRYRSTKNNDEDNVNVIPAAPAPPSSSGQPFLDNAALALKGGITNFISEGLLSTSTATPFKASNGSGLTSLWQSRSAAISPAPFSYQSAEQAPTPATCCAPAPATKMRARSLLCGPDDCQDHASTKQKRWSWLQNRRDAAGKSPEDPAYDPRTILIPAQELSRLKGFNAQYWSIKRDAMDLVLFVRVGAFYELYDLDADIGLRIGLNPMGSISSRDANMWKVGCTAGAFHQWACKVLALGCSVGRVEECRSSKGEAVQQIGGRKLVARKLMQIYTPGTMLDSFGGSGFDDCTSAQPFIALFEGSNGLLGCCIVDVPSATVAISQWQEVDVARSMLVTLLNQANPAEILILGPGYISQETRKSLKRHKPLVADGVERPLVVTWLRRFELQFDPEDPNEVPALLERVASAYFNHGGKETAFQSAAETLCLMPHAAAAFLMAIAHLTSAGVASHVLPHATISSLASFTPQGASTTGHMLLDATAISSLELVEGSLGGSNGSLLSYLAAGAASAAGRRRIREWILSPLYRVGDINERLDVVSVFMQLPEALGSFQTLLLQAPDCERLMPKVATLLAAVSYSHGCSTESENENEVIETPTVDSKDAAAGAGAGTSLNTARFLPAAKLFEGLCLMMEAISQLQHAVDFQRVGGAAALPPLARALRYGSEIAEALESLSMLFHSERFAAGEEDGGLTLQPGLCPKYDDAIAEVSAARAALDEVVELERKALSGATSSPSAVNPVLLRKVKLVEVSGDLVLEVPNALKDRILTSHSLIKETKTVVRVSVPAATAAAAKLATAKEAAEDAVLCYLAQSADLFLGTYHSFLGFITSVASLDALAAFAERIHPQSAATGCTFCRPVFTANATSEDQSPPLLNFQGLWNPQLLLSDALFSSNRYGQTTRSKRSKMKIQPNDLLLGGEGNISSALLLTGANTGGKSTLLRSACLAVILAQVGAFVPCTACVLAPVDRILLRMGAQDRIAAGESTFCVEMTETSAVLRHAQPSSLVVLDELGRGTSTHDGNAIAAAVAWWLTKKSRCRMLFATHYHGLTRDRELLAAGAILGHMESAVDEHGLVPSYKLMPGAAPEGSCGLAVAKTAGLPANVVQRAEQIALKMEIEGQDQLEKLRSRAVTLLREKFNGKGVKAAVADVQASIRQALAMEL